MSDTDLAQALTDAVLAVPGVNRIYTVTAPARMVAALTASVHPHSPAPRPRVVVTEDGTATVTIGVRPTHSAATVARAVYAALDTTMNTLRPHSATRITVTIAQID